MSLSLEEAVELAHAWVQAMADSVGARTLLIKGPALFAQSLRASRVSSDVDVLVHPADFEEMCAALHSRGWRERPAPFISSYTSTHSRTYIHERWPCDIDLHRFYPGFLADPVTTFETLWTRRVQMWFAHHQCTAADRLGNLMVLALHSLRGQSKQGRYVSEARALASASLTEGERDDLKGLAIATGSTATLESVLADLGVEVEASDAELTSRELREWHERVDVGAYGSYFWLWLLRRSGWRNRAEILWRAVWPSDDDMRLARADFGSGPRSLNRERFRRWSRGVVTVPRAALTIWRHRRSP